MIRLHLLILTICIVNVVKAQENRFCRTIKIPSWNYTICIDSTDAFNSSNDTITRFYHYELNSHDVMFEKYPITLTRAINSENKNVKELWLKHFGKIENSLTLVTKKDSSFKKNDTEFFICYQMLKNNYQKTIYHSSAVVTYKGMYFILKNSEETEPLKAQDFFNKIIKNINFYGEPKLVDVNKVKNEFINLMNDLISGKTALDDVFITPQLFIQNSSEEDQERYKNEPKLVELGIKQRKENTLKNVSVLKKCKKLVLNEPSFKIDKSQPYMVGLLSKFTYDCLGNPITIKVDAAIIEGKLYISYSKMILN